MLPNQPFRLRSLFLVVSLFIPTLQGATNPNVDTQVEALLYLDPVILDYAANQVSQHDLKILEQAIEHREIGLSLPSGTLPIIYKLTGPIQPQHCTTFTQLHEHILQKLHYTPTIRHTTQHHAYHELLSQPLPGDHTEQSTNFITLPQPSPRQRATWQKRLNQHLRRQSKTTLAHRDIPLENILATRIHPDFIPPFLQALKRYIQARKMIERYDNLRHTDDLFTDKKSLRRKCKQAYRALKRQAQALNIPLDALYLLKDLDDITLQRDPKTGQDTLYINIDDETTHHTTTYGERLILHIQPPTSDDYAPNPPHPTLSKDLYANEKITLKDSLLQQKTHHKIAAFLQIYTDQTTQQPIYCVYYQAYDPEDDTYTYYFWASDTRILEPIDEIEFFEEIQHPDVRALTYERTRVEPIHTPQPWLRPRDLNQAKYIGLGTFFSLLLFLYQQDDKGIKGYSKELYQLFVPPRRLKGPVIGLGIHNFTNTQSNVCWCNASVQGARVAYRDVLVNTTNSTLNKATKAFLAAIERGKGGKKGVRERDIVKWRKALTGAGFSIRRDNPRMQDADELLTFFEIKNDINQAPWQLQRQAKYKALADLQYDYTQNLVTQNQVQSAFDNIIQQRQTINTNQEFCIKLQFPEEQQPSISMAQLIENYENYANIECPTIPADQFRVIFNIQDGNDWKNLLKNLQAYKFKEKELKLQKELTKYQGTIQTIALTECGIDLSGAKLTLRDLYEKALKGNPKDDLDGLKNKTNVTLTEALYRSKQIPERGACLQVKDFYEKTLQGKESLLTQNLQAIYKDIAAGLKQVNLKSTEGDATEQKVKQWLTQQASPIDIDNHGNIAFRYQSSRSSKIALVPGKKAVRISLGRYPMKRQNETFQDVASRKNLTKVTGTETIQIRSDFASNAPKVSLQRIAFTIHDGGGTSIGHYYTYAQEDGQWYIYDDEKVHKINKNVIETGIKIGKNTYKGAQDAYIFYYRKVEPQTP